MFSFSGLLWRWQGDAPASWVFITLPGDIAFAIRAEAPEKAWGSVAVTARIGATAWRTSLFPQKVTGTYLLPVKAAVRKAENLHDGDTAAVTLDLA